MHGTGITIPRYGIHPYYTLNLTKIQVKLAKIPFFVNYDDFYVNIVMSTSATARILQFIIFDYWDNILGAIERLHTKYCLCKFSFIKCDLGKYHLPHMQDAQFSLRNFVSSPVCPSASPAGDQNASQSPNSYQQHCDPKPCEFASEE